MKEIKLQVKWLIPLSGAVLLAGWFLGRQGWSIKEIDGGFVKLAPPATATATEVSSSPAVQRPSSESAEKKAGQSSSDGSHTASTTLNEGQLAGPFREHQNTPIVGSSLLVQGTYSDGLAPFTEADVAQHLGIQRIRLEENPDACAIAFLDSEKVWLATSVRTELTINGDVVGEILGPTGKHGYIFDIAVRRGERICLTYFEQSGFHIIFGPDMYYHYDSYCYRGNCE